MDQARDQYSIVEAALATEEKGRKEHHTIFFTSSDTDKTEAITDLKKPRKVKYQIHSRSEQNAECWILLCATQERILADSVYATISYLSMLKGCVVKVVNKVKTRIIRRTTCASRGPEATLRNIYGRKGFDAWCNSWEAEIKIADVELWPNYIRESQLVERGTTRTRSTCKRITQGQQSEWEGREENSWRKQLRVA